jgi:hypothetical protein
VRAVALAAALAGSLVAEAADRSAFAQPATTQSASEWLTAPERLRSSLAAPVRLPIALQPQLRLQWPLLAQPRLQGPLQAQAQAAVAAAALEHLLGEARRLMAESKPLEALRLLEPETATYAGNPAFDYQLGIAALDSGDPGRAIMALERVLARDPGNTVARAEIGRAFLVAREREAARREFEAVYGDELPPAVRDTVERYLAILALPESQRTARFTGSVDLATGFDNNVNLGTSLDRWVIGDGQALTPLPASRPRKSAFQSVGVLVEYFAPIGGRADWTIGMNLNQRINPSQHNYDLGSADATTGFGWLSGRSRYSVSAQLQHLWLDQTSFREAAGVSAQWQREIGASSQVGLYGQWFALRFPDQSSRNARRQVLGATAIHGFDDAGTTVAIGNLYLGREASTVDVDSLSFDFYGARAGLSRAIAARWRGAASVAWEQRRHDAPDRFFGVVRSDRQFEARLGLDRELDSNLTLTPQISYLRNASNLGPNEFDRMQLQVGLRYRF